MNMTLTSYITFIKAHEKLITIVLASFLLYRTGQGIENVLLRKNEQKAQQAAAVVTNDAATNKVLSDQLAQVKAQTQQQNDKLNQDIAAKLDQLKKQQAVNAQATQQQILDRWKLLVPMKPGAVQVNGVVDQITPDTATKTVQALEQIPVLQSDIQDLNQELVSDAVVIVKQSDLITGLNTQLVDEKKSHVADVNVLKQKSRTSWLHGFKWGVIVGAVGTEVIRVGVGHP